MPTPPHDQGLSDAEMEIWSSVATLLERLPTALDAQLQRDNGITHFEHGILYALFTAPQHTLRLSVLADYANSTLSRLSRAVSRLEAKGWVVRQVDATDGRFTLGILTEDGVEAVLESTPRHHALIQQLIFDAVTPAQARQLGALSRKISSAIGPESTWTPPRATA